MYQFTFDQAGTFYILEDPRGGSVTDSAYTDTGVNVSGPFNLGFNVWSQTVAAGQVLVTPAMGGSVEPTAFAFQADAIPEPATMSLLALADWLCCAAVAHK